MNEVWVITRLFINDDGNEAEEMYSIWLTEERVKEEMDRLNALEQSIIDDDFYTYNRYDVLN